MTLRRIFLAALALAASATQALRAETAPLPRSTPEEQGIASSAILQFVDQAEEKLNVLHSLIIVRHGHVVAEGWWAPYSANEPHMLFSLSKSFTSTAVGLAIAEGRLSLDDRIIDLFPGEAPVNPSKNLQQMRVRDLLRMATGQRAEDINSFPFMAKGDLVKIFLEMSVPDVPGTHFIYNTEATYMLSAAVQKVTGQTVLDYLKPRLLDPLGITGATWEESAQGINMGGFGLSLRTEDIAKFGLLYLQRGMWNGKQVIPAAWVDEATSLQIANGSDPKSDWNQGYGYQFWRARHGIYRGDGAYGQFCIVIPKSDTVIAITSGTGDMPAVMNLLWDVILPALGDGALPADPTGDAALAAKLAGLRLKTEEGEASSPMAAKVSGRRFVFPDNALKLASVTFREGTAGGPPTVEAELDGAQGTIPCGFGAWSKGTFPIDGADAPIAASGAWSSEDTFTFTYWRYRTPFSQTTDLRFSGDRLILETVQNVGSKEGRVRLVGTAQP